MNSPVVFEIASVLPPDRRLLLLGKSLGEVVGTSENFKQAARSRAKMYIIFPRDVMSVNVAFVEGLLRPEFQLLTRRRIVSNVIFVNLSKVRLEGAVIAALDRFAPVENEDGSDETPKVLKKMAIEN